jgi:nucleoside-diphosphate-sugar epimerase
VLTPPGSVLVTGGQGFTGRYLRRRWLADDESVRIVSVGRSPHRADTFNHSVSWAGASVPAPVPQALREAGADPDDRDVYRTLDLLDTVRLAELLRRERVATIVHLAGSLRDEPFDRLVANNLRAVHSLFEAVVTAGTGSRVVLCSSGSVYGAVADADLPITEDHSPAPIDLYSVTKRAAEDVGSVYRRSRGVDVVVARLFNLLGAGEDERHLGPTLARQFAERVAGVSDGGVVVGPLDTSRDFVDVRDVAAALVLVATAAAPDEVYNVASGRETPTQELFAAFADRAGRHDGARQELAPRPLDFRRQRVDISRLAALGFRPACTIAESVDAMLGYYLDDVAGADARRRDAAMVSRG